METTKRYSPEVRERTVRLVFEHQHEYESQWSTIQSISAKIHGMQVGTLIKFNQKTVTVLTDDGRRRWKVSPQMLSPVTEDTGNKKMLSI